MRTVDRLVVMAIGLVLVAAAVAMLLPSGGTHELDVFLAYLRSVKWRTALAVVVLMALAIYLFWLALRRRRREKTILCDTPLGEVRIAERAVETLAGRATRKVKGVQDAFINVRATTAGLDIFVETTVGPDQSIPQITQEIRTRVAEYIRSTVGVSVNTVAVLVNRVAAESRARVE
ncbi:MAG: alkaline shock response membrane anchor protein AmaP [Patescibacteria group bacterium]